MMAAPAKAQFWPQENSFSRQIVYATCGEPEIPVADKCICGGLLAYDIDGSAGLDVSCAGNLVPNIIHQDMTTARMLRFLIRAYYGSSVFEFCKIAADDGSCADRLTVAGIGSSLDEAYFVGHFTGVLIGEEKCLLSSYKAPASDWASGPAIGKMDLSALDDQDHLETFQVGCRNNFRNVLLWLDRQ